VLAAVCCKRCTLAACAGVAIAVDVAVAVVVSVAVAVAVECNDGGRIASIVTRNGVELNNPTWRFGAVTTAKVYLCNCVCNCVSVSLCVYKSVRVYGCCVVSASGSRIKNLALKC